VFRELGTFASSPTTGSRTPTDPEWKDNAGYKEWAAFMDMYYPSGDKTDNAAVYGPSIAATTVQVLKEWGGELTRENVMRQAAKFQHFPLPMLQPGITSIPAPPSSSRSRRCGWSASTVSVLTPS
jgi:branched-chain amino acid transport system substrate-binding protein